MTEVKVIGLVRQSGYFFHNSVIFQAGGSAQGLKLPCFVQKNYFFANWMDKPKITLYTGVQEETISHYRFPGINQKLISTGKNPRQCFYGRQKMGARGEPNR
jgi:hypothetical protein